MPAQERSITIEERALGGDQPQHRHREAMARNTSPKGSNPRAEAHISQWDDAGGWDQEPDDAARHRAKRLLSRPSSGFHRLGDKFAALQLWLTGERWVKRLAIAIAVLAVLAVFTVLAMFSIGIFVLPITALMATAVVMTPDGPSA